MNTQEVDEYTSWNRLLVYDYLLKTDSKHQTYLNISPKILALLWNDVNQQKITPEIAKHNFVKAVLQIYTHKIIPYGLKIISGLNTEEIPNSVAFLGLTVLVAYEKNYDDQCYYKNLSKLLGDREGKEYSEQFKDDFKKLWTELSEWLKSKHNIYLAHPESNAGPWHIVKIPTTHCPLRQIDLDKLPKFFSLFGYEPNIKPPIKLLENDFGIWIKSNPLTKPGLEAYREQRIAVLTQVIHELEAWDGISTDYNGHFYASIELHLCFERNRPILSYFPRRHKSFPLFLDDGVHRLETFHQDQSWYDPLPVPADDGLFLVEGFKWFFPTKDKTFVLCWKPFPTFPLVRSNNNDYSGFVSSRSLLLGISCTVMCHKTVITQVADYLSAVCGQKQEYLVSKNLPIDWYLFKNVIAKNQVDTKLEIFKTLQVESKANIMAIGGLKVGHGTWLEGAPPELHYSRSLSKKPTVTLNGQTVNNQDKDPDGLISSGVFLNKGNYTVTCDNAVFRVKILEPTISNYAYEFDITTKKNLLIPEKKFVVALPSGTWVILGYNYNEIKEFPQKSKTATILTIPFNPVWAINFNRNSNCSIISLAKLFPYKNWLGTMKYSPKHLVVSWAQTIRKAHLTKSNISSLYSTEPKLLQSIWQAYVKVAEVTLLKLKTKIS